MAHYCFYLHDSYITKFDFMNCAFANLVLAWLYNLYTLDHPDLTVLTFMEIPLVLIGFNPVCFQEDRKS